MFGFYAFNSVMPISIAVFWGVIIYLLFSTIDKQVGVESSTDIATREFADSDASVEELDDIKKKS
ncbi:hypothetical protein HWV00_05250 [Moritella sp. 24]|uniref:hypothetical protein n=1 Tax=Moritella sp. 24 TaxID=2746230 RepID=UPI001BACEE00|nr:hypothetical protein [Moritella sp. 24]QUM75689.1 hypothetical protein HWV00_05250 [Moritella sp. 24]